MPTHTRGFKTLLHRSDHFTAHGARLGVATEQSYEEFADAIFGLPPSSVLEFRRPWNGELVRYDQVREVFAVRDSHGFIKTCYNPEPLVHGCATNLDYYLEEEAKA
jgi:pyocin large subunit-like protein